MKKLLIATAALCTALPFTFDGVTPTVSKAQAVIGRPLTPGSIAGVHRRAMRRTYGVGANIGYHPVARRAAIAAAATGAGYYGAGYGGRPLFASAGWGWNRPLFAYGGNGMGGAINVPAGSVPQPLYTEAQMAAARYGCYPAPFDYSTRVCVPRW